MQIAPQLQAALNARLDPITGKTRPTKLAFDFFVFDLAGNVQTSRTTAMFVPSGFTAAAVAVLPSASITVASALPRSLTTLLLRNGSSYYAPYVWQARADAIEVSGNASLT